MTKFTDLGLSKEILKGISELGFEEAMPVQKEVIPVVLESESDIVALAQTGTGKTVYLFRYSDKQTVSYVTFFYSPVRSHFLSL